MSIKDSTFKKINWAYIILSVILGLVLVYGIVNTMVSLKYENEKELIDLHTNPASDYIKIINQGDGDSDTFSLIAGYGVFVERRTGFGIFAAFPVRQGDFPESDRE